MKRNQKRLTIRLFLLLAVACLCGAFTGCSSCAGEEQTPPAQQTEITLNYTENKISITSSFYLEASSGTQKLEGVSYRSSDSTVVSVTAEGKVTGERLGTATVTATLGSMQNSCTVTVEMGEILPLLQLESVSGEETVQIEENATLDLNGFVKLGKNRYDDGKISYSLSNPEAGTVVDGVFIPNPLTGQAESVQTTVTATAKWRGIESGLLTRTVSVNVIRCDGSYTYLTVNGKNYVEALTLYTTDSFEGKSYQTDYEFEYGVVVNGKPFQDLSGVSISVREGAESVSATLGKISALAGGSAVVELKHTAATGEAVTLAIDVNVIYPVEKHQTVVENVSAMDGFEVPSEIMDTNSVVKAVQNLGEENEKQLTVSNGKIYGLETSGSGLTQTKVTFYNAEYAYTAKVTGYSGIITTAERLQTILWWYYSSDNKTNYQETYDEATFKQRYFVLGNDIEVAATQWSSALYDVIDGQGHTITVLEGNARGLFGNILQMGVVKNVAIKFVGNLQGQSMENRQQQVTIIAQFVRGTLDNVYVDYAPASNQVYAHHILGGYIYKEAKISNVYVHTADNVTYPVAPAEPVDPEAPVEPDLTKRGYGVLGQAIGQLSGIAYDGVYVVSKNLDVMLKTPDTGEPVTYKYASNESTTDGIAGVFRYETAEAMLSANVTQVGSWAINEDGTASYVA